MVDVFNGVHLVVIPDELLVVEKVAEPRGTVVRMGDVEAVTHRAIDIAKKREGEIVFVGKGFLFGNGVHRDSDGFDSGGSELGR